MSCCWGFSTSRSRGWSSPPPFSVRWWSASWRLTVRCQDSPCLWNILRFPAERSRFVLILKQFFWQEVNVMSSSELFQGKVPCMSELKRPRKFKSLVNTIILLLLFFVMFLLCCCCNIYYHYVLVISNSNDVVMHQLVFWERLDWNDVIVCRAI